MALERENLKCPWNKFENCVKRQCPFYGKVARIYRQGDGYEWYESELGCRRADNELENFI